MKVKCPECEKEYDDLYYSTQCPHEYFEMHCGIIVDGEQGCAHTVEELIVALNGVLPNPLCERLLMFREFQKSLKEESCHFGDCEQ